MIGRESKLLTLDGWKPVTVLQEGDQVLSIGAGSLVGFTEVTQGPQIVRSVDSTEFFAPGAGVLIRPTAARWPHETNALMTWESIKRLSAPVMTKPPTWDGHVEPAFDLSRGESAALGLLLTGGVWDSKYKDRGDAGPMWRVRLFSPNSRRRAVQEVLDRWILGIPSSLHHKDHHYWDLTGKVWYLSLRLGVQGRNRETIAREVERHVLHLPPECRLSMLQGMVAARGQKLALDKTANEILMTLCACHGVSLLPSRKGLVTTPGVSARSSTLRVVRSHPDTDYVSLEIDTRDSGSRSVVERDPLDRLLVAPVGPMAVDS